MFTRRRRHFHRRPLFLRWAGLVLVVAGAIILAVLLPGYVWWGIGGVVLIYLGWQLYLP